MGTRGVQIALIVSLIVNVFVLGAVAGFFVGPVFAPPGPPPVSKGPAEAAGERLNPADQFAFHKMLEDADEASGPIALDARQARRELNGLLRAQPFDRAGATAAMARARADDQQVRAHLDETLLDFAAKLSPQERTALADGFRQAAFEHWMQHAPGGPPPHPGGPG